MRYQIYMLKRIHLKRLTFECTMACQSIPRIHVTQKGESDFSYFHLGPSVCVNRLQKPGGVMKTTPPLSSSMTNKPRSHAVAKSTCVGYKNQQKNKTDYEC